jgi:hypothetical protein
MASEQYSKKKKKKVSHNKKEPDEKMMSPHNDMIGGNVMRAGMENKKTPVKTKKRGKVAELREKGDEGGAIRKLKKKRANHSDMGDKGNEGGITSKDPELGDKGHESSATKKMGNDGEVGEKSDDSGMIRISNRGNKKSGGIKCSNMGY